MKTPTAQDNFHNTGCVSPPARANLYLFDNNPRGLFMTAAVIFKIFIAILFILILISLASGVIFLVKDDSGSKRLVTSLTFRITLSIILFISLIIGFIFGWIQPHGLGH